MAQGDGCGWTFSEARRGKARHVAGPEGEAHFIVTMKEQSGLAGFKGT